MMKEEEFKNLLEDLCREAYEYELTEHEKLCFWNQYLASLAEEWDDEKAEKVYNVTLYDEEARLIYRQGLAISGKELTPRQLDILIIVLEIVLSMHECT
jgi:hypothetical protein